MKAMKSGLRLREHGFSILEVLLSIVIIAMGLLGLAGLQARMVTAETESYQRSQGLILVEFMVNTIRRDDANANAGYYDEIDPSKPTHKEWLDAIAGSNAGVAALIGGKGCLKRLNPGSSPVVIRVSVAWQGLSPTVVPPGTQDPTTGATVAEDCGKGAYGDDALRRVVSSTVVVLPPGT